MRKDVPITTRNQVLIRARGLCEDCEELHPLTLHHLHYDSVGAEIPEDLVALCWKCHQKRHRDINGDYWHDPAEMASYWDSFYDALTKDD